MQCFNEHRLFYAKIHDRGNTRANVKTVRFVNMSRASITELRSWGVAYSSDHPFVIDVLFQRDGVNDPRLFEVELQTSDANAAFEAKLRFG